MDAREYHAGIAAPEVTIGGRTYTGRILSLEEFLPFMPWAEKARNNQLTPQELLGFVYTFLRAVFPWRPWYLWQGDPVRRLAKLPWVQLQSVFSDFFVRQVATVAPPTPRTSGATSTDAEGMATPSA